MRIAMTYTRIRPEERFLLDEFARQGIDITPVDIRQQVFNPADSSSWDSYDAVFDRSMSLTNSITSLSILEGFGLRCINSLKAVELCSDKLFTSIALSRAGIATPEVRVATTYQSGLDAIDEIGYPAVLKPIVGSWGRLVSRVNDRHAAEAILEHRETLGSVQQKVMYVQEFIDKPDRDLRVFVVGGEPIAAIARSSEHWVTNTARGATAEGVELTDELCDISRQAAQVTGADVVAVDLLECPRRGLLVNEMNHSMEFRNSMDVTGVNIASVVVEHIAEIAQNQGRHDSMNHSQGVVVV